jgi:alpha-glucosidase
VTRLAPADPDWWKDAIVYQIYPRSFADADGDGIGDLRGIASRVDYLRELGVDAVWLSPFYPSPLADGGYDVADYRDVDPRIGTLAEFDALVAALHAAGIRVVVDIVPNHSSDRHPWFREALAAAPGSPERERYIFRDGLGPDKATPPTDWVAMFGGSVWEDAGDGQFYLHLFAPEQPDWNWDHPDVRADFLRTLRFWADRGVDGFRVDVAHGLAKDLSGDLPTQAQLAAIPTGPDHPFYDRDEVQAIYAEWRELFDTYTPPRSAVAEVWLDVPERRGRYANRGSLGQAFNFDLLRADFDAAAFRDVIADHLAAAAEAGSSSTWVLSNHDVVRHASRYGLPLLGPGEPGGQVAGGAAGVPATLARDTAWLATGGARPREDQALGARRARAATLLLLALPGSAYLYQGEELGLREVADIPAAERQDPTFFRSGGAEVGRDGCRVPLPWEATGPSLGFGPGLAHLPQPAWFAGHAVAVQEADPASTLAFYRQALATRRRLLGKTPAQGPGPDVAPAAGPNPAFTWLDSGAGVLGFERPGGWQSWTNFTAQPVPLPAGQVLLTSGPLTAEGELPSATTAWVEVPPAGPS